MPHHPQFTAIARVTLATLFAGAGIAACASNDSSVPTLTAAGEAGREITRTNGCAACHGRNGEGSAGPAFVGLFGSTVEFKDGTTAVADADYLYESITDPAARLVEGYGFPMPPNDLSDEQVESVITYIEELADAADGS